jgi:6-pyruvoyltetrahydropterin/6-carboxytetrahydropterin synthase
MYSIRTTYEFIASHALTKAGKLIEESHSHTFKLEVELTSEKLDETGCVVDFRDLDSRMADVLVPYTNTGLHEHPKFGGRSPSAEVLAETFFAEINSCIADMPARLERVTVWEDECHAGSYKIPSTLTGEG